MAIIYINGEPVEVDETAQSNSGNSECPPGGIAGDEADGQVGESERPEYNFEDLVFLSPIEQIHITDDLQTSAFLREINLIDEYNYYRSIENIFVQDESGNTIIGDQTLLSNADVNIFRKQLYVSDQFTSHPNLNSGELRSVTGRSDKFRILNNRLWTLQGTEQNPIQEVWLNDAQYRDGSAALEYVVDFNPAEGNKMTIDFSDSDTISLPEDLDERRDFIGEKLSFVFEKGVTYTDETTSVRQPLLKKEVEEISTVTLDAIKNTISYIIDFDVTINNRSVDPLINLKPEYSLRSLYREYYRALFPDFTSECNLTEDRVQKFISSTSEIMADANEDMQILNSFDSYVTLEISRPNALVGHASIENLNRTHEEMSQLFGATEHDKYFIELLQDRKGKIQKVVIADESGGNQTQVARVNDQFSIGFVHYLANTVQRFLHYWDHVDDEGVRDYANARFNRVINDAVDYPLKFRFFDDKEGLSNFETQQIANFKDGFSQIETRNRRNGVQILHGKKAPSAIIGYKIEKRRPGTNGLVQTFYIMEPPRPKSSTAPPLKFIDTQVHYGRSYLYKIFAITVVFGAGYRYDSFDIDAEDSKAVVSINTSLSIQGASTPGYTRIYEVPYFQKIVSLADLPPLPPEVSFLPDNKNLGDVKVMLNHNVGSRNEAPISIMSSDSSYITKMLSSQPESEDGKISYYSDSVPEKYEIFMSLKPPESYQDFSLMKSVGTHGEISKITDMNSPVPNKDYYFVFRSKEPAGISNPSPIYKFRMVASPNGNFMILKEYDMLEKKEEHINLPFQKSLKISPALLQKSIKYPEGTDLSSRDFALSAPNLEDITIGTLEDSIWDKQYKFRITSKNTGRKIDINATFSQNSFHNDRILQLTPDECPPVEPRKLKATKCLSLGELILPVIKGQVKLTHIHQCELIESETTETTLSQQFDLDLANIDGNGTNIFEYAASRQDQFNVFDKDPEFIIDATEENIEHAGPVQLVTFSEYCRCEQDPEQLVQMFTQAVLDQYERAENGEDYIAVFDTQGNIPPHIQQSVAAHMAGPATKLEQKNWWSLPKAGDVADQVFDSVSALYNETKWPSKLLQPKSGPPIPRKVYDSSPSGYCLEILKKHVQSLLTLEFTYEQARDFISQGSEAQILAGAASASGFASLQQLFNQMDEEIDSGRVANDCTQIPDNLPQRKLMVTPASIEIEENDPAGETNVGTFEVRLSHDPRIEPGTTVESVKVSAEFVDDGAAVADSVTVSPSEIVLDKRNWNKQQLNVFTVTSANTDSVSTGDREHTLRFVTSEHPIEEFQFNGLQQDRIVKILENDLIAFQVSPGVNTIKRVVEDDPSTAFDYKIKLKSQPTGNVTIQITNEATFSGHATFSANELTFDASDWNTFKTITVTPVSDSDIEGFFSELVIFSTKKSGTRDINFDDAQNQLRRLQVTDNDAAGFTITDPQGVEITNDSGTDVVHEITLAEGSGISFTVSTNTSVAGDLVLETLENGSALPIRDSSAADDKAFKISSPTEVPMGTLAYATNAAANSQRLWTFTHKNDNIYRENESYEFKIRVKTSETTDPNYEALTQTQTIKINILEDDPAPCDGGRVRNEDTGQCECPDGFEDVDGECVQIPDPVCSEAPLDILGVGAISTNMVDHGDKCEYSATFGIGIRYECPENSEITTTYQLRYNQGFMVNKDISAQALDEQLNRMSAISRRIDDILTRISGIFTRQDANFKLTQEGLDTAFASENLGPPDINHFSVITTSNTTDSQDLTLDGENVFDLPSKAEWTTANCNPCPNLTEDGFQLEKKTVNGVLSECLCPDGTQQAGFEPFNVGRLSTTLQEFDAPGFYCNGVIEPEIHINFFFLVEGRGSASRLTFQHEPFNNHILGTRYSSNFNPFVRTADGQDKKVIFPVINTNPLSMTFSEFRNIEFDFLHDAENPSGFVTSQPVINSSIQCRIPDVSPIQILRSRTPSDYINCHVEKIKTFNINNWRAADGTDLMIFDSLTRAVERLVSQNVVGQNFTMNDLPTNPNNPNLAKLGRPIFMPTPMSVLESDSIGGLNFLENGGDATRVQFSHYRPQRLYWPTEQDWQKFYSKQPGQNSDDHTGIGEWLTTGIFPDGWHKGTRKFIPNYTTMTDDNGPDTIAQAVYKIRTLKQEDPIGAQRMYLRNHRPDVLEQTPLGMVIQIVNQFGLVDKVAAFSSHPNARNSFSFDPSRASFAEMSVFQYAYHHADVQGSSFPALLNTDPAPMSNTSQNEGSSDLLGHFKLTQNNVNAFLQHFFELANFGQ